MAQKYSNIPYYYTLLTDFIALLYPEICIGCGDALMHHDRMICFECSIDMPHTYFENHQDNPVEKLFWYKTTIEQAASVYFFSKKSRIQKMIHSFKYKGNDKAAIFMGELLGKKLLDSDRFSKIDQIIPVPLHPNKLKIRGYNQAEKIAEGMASILNVPVNTTALIRVSHNDTQTKKAIFNRWTNVKTIFKIDDSKSIENQHVLIVDDVITSGSTIEACANQILTIEGCKVSIASLAVANG
jgi:ComF family protein